MIGPEALPPAYAWLAREPGPRMIVEAVKLFGVVEGPGTADNPIILGWAKELGLAATYSEDAIPWCGLFVGIVASRAGKEIPSTPLWALSWRSFGHAVDLPMLGDVCVKTRAGGGHVTIYVGEDATHYHLLSGNQSDAVNIRRFPKTIPWTFRRPNYRVQPANVRRVFLAPEGAISSKEA